MKLLSAHTLLLLASLGLAYQTWARDDAVMAPGSVALWRADVDQISSIVYEAGRRRVVVERRREDTGTYLWGSVTRPAGPDSASAARDTTTAFVVGEGANALLGLLASPRSLRDLGTLDAEREEEYGLAGSPGRLVVQLDRDTHELLVGGVVFGTGDRYVRDAATERAYVLQGAAFGSLDSAEQIFFETRLHAFALDAVAAVTVRTERGERTMRKAADGPLGSSWTPPDATDRPDQTFANFMERLGQLWVAEYIPSVDRASLNEVASVDYLDDAGSSIGHTGLLRSDSGGEPTYYVVTELTRVPVRLIRGAAERFDQDVAQLL